MGNAAAVVRSGSALAAAVRVTAVGAALTGREADAAGLTRGRGGASAATAVAAVPWDLDRSGCAPGRRIRIRPSRRRLGRLRGLGGLLRLGRSPGAAAARAMCLGPSFTGLCTGRRGMRTARPRGLRRRGNLKPRSRCRVAVARLGLGRLRLVDDDDGLRSVGAAARGRLALSRVAAVNDHHGRGVVRRCR